MLFDEDGRPLLGCWDQIITPTDWSQVQFELQLRRQKRGLGPGQSRPAVVLKYLMSGIFTCGKCGRGLVGGWLGRKTDPARREYRCPPPARGGCNGTSIMAEAAEAAVEVAMEVFLTNLFQASEIDERHDPNRLVEIHNELEEQSRRKQELIQRWTDGRLAEEGLEEPDYFQMLTGLNRKISALNVKINAAESGDSPKVPLDDLLNGWRNGTLAQRRSLLRRYLHRTEILPPTTRAAAQRRAAIKTRLKPIWKHDVEIAA